MRFEQMRSNVWSHVHAHANAKAKATQHTNRSLARTANEFRISNTPQGEGDAAQTSLRRAALRGASPRGDAVGDGVGQGHGHDAEEAAAPGHEK